MAKKRKQQGGNPSKKKIDLKRTPKSNWGAWLRNGLLVGGFFAFIGFSLAAFSHFNKIERDLSVIGNGMPTVVQVHDPNCSLCQRLKRNLDSVKGEFSEDIQFKTASLNTPDGRSLAHKHNASSVTLLLFNARGHLVQTMEGVTPSEDIDQALTRLARR